ncbi:MAG: hypothetical protein ACOYN0_15460 [Phycisphaerales bacterium]
MSAIGRRLERLKRDTPDGCNRCRGVVDWALYTMHHQPRPPHLFCERCGRDCTVENRLQYEGSPDAEAEVFPGPAFDKDLSRIASRHPYHESWDAPAGFVRRLVQERRMPWNP